MSLLNQLQMEYREYYRAFKDAPSYSISWDLQDSKPLSFIDWLQNNIWK